MTWFLTRVELLDVASDSDNIYDELHEEMEKKGFSRQITGDKGGTYHLPPAEYFYETSDTSTTARYVCDLASDAADETGKKSRVITSRVDAFAWTNLKKV